METGHPSTRAVNSGSGNRALDVIDPTDLRATLSGLYNQWRSTEVSCLVSFYFALIALFWNKLIQLARARVSHQYGGQQTRSNDYVAINLSVVFFCAKEIGGVIGREIWLHDYKSRDVNKSAVISPSADGEALKESFSDYCIAEILGTTSVP